MTPTMSLTGLHLTGITHMRGALLTLPIETIKRLLPPGLEPGIQTITSPGFHPVLLFFNDNFRTRLSVPSLIPSITYHEFHIGIPYTSLTQGPGSGSGPFYFMPHLYLDHWAPIAGGILFWGFAKQIASMLVTGNSYTVTDALGRTVASLQWSADDRFEIPWSPVLSFIPFQQILPMLQQPLVSRLPVSVGPYFVVSDFIREWDTAMVRRLQNGSSQTILTASTSHHSRSTPNSNEDPMVYFEVTAGWDLSLPYSPGF
jgi:hypothetical protein